jgi:hypothetical protein
MTPALTTRSRRWTQLRDRGRPFARFAELVGLRDDEAILVVGAGSGAALEPFTTTNPIIAVDLAPNTSEWLHNANVVVRTGDGTRLPFADREFPVAFSDSVIEHVPPRLRPAFAAEIARVSERYDVQTPDRWFPIAPGSRVPLVHLLPRFLRGRRGTGGPQLLTAADLQRLFPDATIHRTRVLGLPKSLMAVRGPAEEQS